jgi:hypothetical protein
MALVLFSKYGFIPQDKIKRVFKRIRIDAGPKGHDPFFGYGVPILPDNCIINMLDNPLWTFRILHQSTNFDWKIGDWITKGEKICRMGNSGTKDFHVHIDAIKGIHPQYSLMMLTKKLLESLKHYLYRFVTWNFFKYEPVITTEYMEEGYPEEQNVKYEHMALDLVLENRKYTNENYDVYYPLEVPGKVLNLGTYLDGTKYIIIGVDENMKFEDVPQDKWYFEEVDFVSDYGLMAGYPDGTFKPDKEVKRAELAQVLYNLEHK